jgi:hypothetical protein
MKYAMLINGSESEWDSATAEENETGMAAMYAWFEKWGAAGKIADGGARLKPTGEARTVRPGSDGSPLVTDGPYLELKEVIGGIVILEADDMDDAVATASTWPGLAGSTSVEVRPIWPM